MVQNEELVFTGQINHFNPYIEIELQPTAATKLQYELHVKRIKFNLKL